MKAQTDRTAASCQRTQTALGVMAIIAAVALAYGLSIRNGFVWDDETFIVNNSYVHDISHWPLYFSRADTVSSDPVLSRMYRPIQTLSFAIDAALWGTWPGGYHLMSILLHLASCLAIIFAFTPLVGNRTAFVAAMVFSVHPALSEGVLSLAARGNQLYTLFALLSIGWFLRTGRPLDKLHLLSVISGLVAMLSKEPAIAYLALLPLLQMATRRPWSLNSRQSVALYLPYIAIATAYVWARAMVVGPAHVMVYWGGSLGSTLLLQAKVFIVYLKLLVWPFHLQGRYSVGTVDSLAVTAAAVNTLLCVLAVLAWRRGGKGKLLALAVAWFYISLAPVANLIPIPGSMMGERFIYFTFAGLIPLMLGTIDLDAPHRWKWLVHALAFVLVLTFASVDALRSRVWRSNASFFTTLAEQEPQDPVVQVRMAMSEIHTGDNAGALRRLERIVQAGFSTPFKADQAAVYYWYAKALLLANRPADAFQQATRAAAFTEGRPLDLVLLQAEAAARSNRLQTARTLLEKALDATPAQSDLWNALGNVLTLSGHRRSALRAYRKAVTLDHTNQEAAINLENLQRHQLPAPRPQQP